jgi:hypothetical protein
MSTPSEPPGGPEEEQPGGPHHQPPSGPGGPGHPGGPWQVPGGPGHPGYAGPPGGPGGSGPHDQGPWNPQGGWQPPPPPRQSSGGTVVGMTFAGIGIFIAVNLVAAVATLQLAGAVRDGAEVVVGAGAVLLAAGALGGGAALIMMRRPWSKGLGLGLMIGWALMSIVSIGYCTGINPEIYTGGNL